jgi:hypothetical protein
MSARKKKKVSFNHSRKVSSYLNGKPTPNEELLRLDEE